MLELKREYLDNATHGKLFLNGDFITHTIELPWRDNRKQISCIPEGTYQLRRRFSAKFKWHYVLLNVPDRSYILIHPANNAQKELQGCIAPVSTVISEGIGTASRKAMQVLLDVLDLHRKKGPIMLCITSNS